MTGPGDSPAWRPSPPWIVWTLPASYVLHLVEESLAGGGFPAWSRDVLGVDVSRAEFVGWNAFGVLLACVGAALAGARPAFRWIEIAMGLAFLGNAAAHVVAGAVTVTYSPGLVSAVLLWVPLASWRVSVAWQHASRRGRRAGLVVGTAAALAPLLVMAL